jgi:hypothetical protein
MYTFEIIKNNTLGAKNIPGTREKYFFNTERNIYFGIMYYYIVTYIFK